jgi:hypothetical protein
MVTAVRSAFFDQPQRDIIEGILDEIMKLRKMLGASTGGAGVGALGGSVVANVASIAAGAEASQTVTVTGAAVGDLVIAAIDDAAPTSGSLVDCFVNARVSAADTVQLNITNTHASTALDLSAAATFRVLVIPKAAVAQALAAMVITKS